MRASCCWISARVSGHAGDRGDRQREPAVHLRPHALDLIGDELQIAVDLPRHPALFGEDPVEHLPGLVLALADLADQVLDLIDVGTDALQLVVDPADAAGDLLLLLQDLVEELLVVLEDVLDIHAGAAARDGVDQVDQVDDRADVAEEPPRPRPLAQRHACRCGEEFPSAHRPHFKGTCHPHPSHRAHRGMLRHGRQTPTTVTLGSQSITESFQVWPATRAEQRARYESRSPGRGITRPGPAVFGSRDVSATSVHPHDHELLVLRVIGVPAG
ncbi:hypothetical protein ACGFYT_27810 [Streptomyces sp. NPDC048208]|uniref:hypothetical protein n=1 Tax=Streptomyces sp. NPDC048208 TaxID=3365515 RepID=UPI00371F2207